MSKQIEKLRAFSCKANLCLGAENQNKFRFPFCAAFLRPTDRLQSADQKLISSGEHLPVCQIDSCSSSSNNGGKFLRYDDIRSISLSQDVFEHLFSRGKVGSRLLPYSELAELYEKFEVISEGERMLIHAQDFSPLRAAGNK